jgi:hypothetical protein
MALQGVRQDVATVRNELEDLQGRIGAEGFDLSLVRIADILVWSETEARGYYRPRE